MNVRRLYQDSQMSRAVPDRVKLRMRTLELEDRLVPIREVQVYLDERLSPHPVVFAEHAFAGEFAECRVSVAAAMQDNFP